MRLPPLPKSPVRLLPLALGIFFTSCLHGARAPEGTPRGRLDLDADGVGGASKRPFAVVSATPQGDTNDPSEVSLLFNRPMRALETAGDEAKAPISIASKEGTRIEGAFRWIGTSAVVFAPTKHLPRASSFVVTVPRGTKALSGESLAEEYRFEFRTPVPKIVRTTPSSGENHLLPTSTFTLFFNQPVDAGSLEKLVHLSAGDKKAQRPVAFTLRAHDDKTQTRIEITPSSKLPLDAAIELTVEKGVKSLEGARPSDEESHLSARTYGPLTVPSFECAKSTPHGLCAAGGGLQVTLSNGVPYKEWSTHVRVDGAPPLKWRTDEDGGSPSSYEWISPSLGPARSYRLVVAAGMKDQFGQALAKEAVFAFQTDDEWPQAAVGMTGTVFEAKGPPRTREVPVTTLNLSSVEIATATPTEEEIAALLADRLTGVRQTLEDLSHLRGGKLETVHPAAPKNVQSVRRVSLDGVLAPVKGRGAIAFGVRWDSRGAQTHVQIASVTDVGLSAKISHFGSLVWLTRLSDGKPIANGSVAIRTEKGGEVFATRTDAQGLAVIPQDKYDPIGDDGLVDQRAVLFARNGDDWTFRRVAEVIEPWRFGIATDAAGRLDPFGLLFTDRTIFRPGETVRVKGLFRRELPKGTATPSGETVKIRALGPDGEEILSTTKALGSFGDVAFDVPIPAASRLGDVQIRASLEGDPKAKRAPKADLYRVVATANVELAAYKPAAFKVSVEPSAPSYIRKDAAVFTSRGDYLFGAPMSGGSLRVTATRGPTYFAPKGTDDLVTDDETFRADYSNRSARAGAIDTANLALGAGGELARTVKLDLPEQRGPEVISFESEVTDLDRQTVASQASAIVHPGEFYVGIKTADLFVKPGKLEVSVAAIEPAGKRRAGTLVEVALYKRSWTAIAQTADDGGGAHHVTHLVDTKVATCNATTHATLASCSVEVPDAGFYVLRASATDPRGNAVAASAPVYAVADSPAGGGPSWELSDTSKVDLVTDKKSYEVGDTATVLVKNPYVEAEALITVARAGIYKEERRLLRGPMPTFQVKITDDLRPNLFVSVLLVRGRTKEAPLRGADVGAPAYRVGYKDIVVNPEARRLKVAVTPSKTDYKPGETVDLDFAVTDRAGKPTKSQLTVYAVDEGVLMLSGYKTPDPIPTFTAPRPLSVLDLESRDDRAKVFVVKLAGTGSDKGMDGGGGGGEVRSDFKATALFEPNVLAPEGKAHVTFKLPDNLTSWRIMAVAAAQDDRFGFAETNVTASRKLMARPALPRFLRAGDAIDAGVVLTAKGMSGKTAEITASVVGELAGEAKKSVTIPPSGSVEVTWKVAFAKAGKAKIAFRTDSEGESDAVVVTRDVLVPTSMEAVALYGQTNGGENEQLGNLSDVRPDVGQLDFRLASTALVGLDDGVESLLEYPYGCTEQLTSRLVPMIDLVDIAADYHLTLPPNLREVADGAVGKIVKNQLSDGGFGYWPDSPRSDPWVSVYALWGLERAKGKGYAVPSDSLDRATHYAKTWLTTGGKKPWQIALAAFAVDVLAEAGAPDPGATTRLFEVRKELPLFGKALLAHAMATSKMNADGVKELVSDLENHLRLTGAGATIAENLGDDYANLLDSDARTTGMVLRAMLAANKKAPLASKLVRGLLDARKHGTWRSTQETAWALLALNDYRIAQENVTPEFDASVFVAGERVAGAPFHGKSTKAASESVAVGALLAKGGSGATLGFRKDGEGTLFYEARLKYAKKTLATKGLDRGFSIEKTMRTLRPEALAEALRTLPKKTDTQAAAGDLVLVDLLVTNPDPREQVVIDDPLPAGLEALDSGLATASHSLDVTGSGGAGDEVDAEGATDDAIANDRAFGSAWFHREIRDDRVLTFIEHMPVGVYHYRYLARATVRGTFVVPPTHAECMYEPETFGRTAAMTYTVGPKPFDAK